MLGARRVPGHADLLGVGLVPGETRDAAGQARRDRCPVPEQLDLHVELGALVVAVLQPEPQVRVARLQNGCECLGHRVIARRVRMVVRPERRRCADPRPLAEPSDAEGHLAERGQWHHRREVGRREGALDVGDRHAGGAVDPGEQPIERHDRLRDGELGERLALRSRQPVGEKRVVDRGADDRRLGPGCLTERAEDRRQVLADRGDAGRQARKAGLAGEVVGADVDRDEGDELPVGMQERDGLVELAAVVVGTDAAVDHRRGRLAGAAELDQLEVGIPLAGHGEELVRVALVGPVQVRGIADRLHARGERVTERQVVERGVGAARAGPDGGGGLGDGQRQDDRKSTKSNEPHLRASSGLRPWWDGSTIGRRRRRLIGSPSKTRAARRLISRAPVPQGWLGPRIRSRSRAPAACEPGRG